MSVKICGVCGFVTTDITRYKINTTKDSKDVCIYCYKSWSKELQKQYKKMTVDEIHFALEQEGYQYPEFFPSFEVEGFVQFDDRHRLWRELSGGTANRNTLTAIAAMIPMVPKSYDDVIRVELFETGNVKKSKEISVKIAYKDGGVLKYFKIVISDHNKTKKTSSVNEWYHEIADSIIEAFEERINKPEEVKKEQSIQISAADELLKYKELFDAGLITKEEFDVQKNKLLPTTNNEINNNDADYFEEEKVIQKEVVKETSESIVEYNETEISDNKIKISGELICPKCGSSNIKEISNLNKAVNLAMFNVFAAGKLIHKWHCNDCRKEW